MAAGMRLLAAALLMACLAVVAARQPAEQEHTLRDSKGISPCAIGPSYWCRSAKNQQQCGVKNQVVGVAGYSTLLSPEQKVSEFCSTNANALKFPGGLIGTPTGDFSVFVLALYWAPTSCPAVGLGNGGFCSAYTQKGYHAATNLVLHGLWPDFGQIYSAPGNPAPYVGFPQWCNGPEGHFESCSIQGKLCKASTPGFNVSSPTFSQTQYEYCLRAQNTKQCLVPDSTIARYTKEWKKYAPGYIGANSTGGYGFLDHEFFKHGSCVGGKLSRNKNAFFETGLEFVKRYTKKGTAAQKAISANAGKNVTLAYLNEAFSAPLINQGTTVLSQSDRRLREDDDDDDDKKKGGKGEKGGKGGKDDQRPKKAKYAAFQCTNDCKISEIWYCIGRDAKAQPTGLYACGPGELASDTCTSKNCTTVQIPAYQ